MKKEYYIRLMEMALSAYTDEHIRDYFERVKHEGLTEHGFPRLTANIGILISHGIRPDLLPLFCQMMDFCCEAIPKGKAANDFSVKEIIFCLMEVEEKQIVTSAQIDAWKNLLGTIKTDICYDVYAKHPWDCVFNWACYTAVSEFMRQYIGLCDASEFIDTQLSTQLQWLDENGMYRDDLDKPPMVYDLVPRGLFAVLLHFGYRGKYYKELDDCLRRTGLMTLKMQSVTGEIPYGGRSNQMVHAEAQFAILFEYEARRYAAEGQLELAAEFKEGVKKALANMAMWLSNTPIRHVKNCFPVESKYGCEAYAYFDKYMITAASFLYVAYLICDDSIAGVEDGIRQESTKKTMAWRTSSSFHKIFLKCGEYFLEFDTAADRHYDASGLGRVHRKGAPSPICISVPCSSAPNYGIDREDAIDLALCPGIRISDESEAAEWMFAVDERTRYEVVQLNEAECHAAVRFNCHFAEGKSLQAVYTVSDDGIEIEVLGEGPVAHLLPVFSFDGEHQSEIRCTGHDLEISYMDWICRYTVDMQNGSEQLFDTGKIGCNRNGHYRAFCAAARDRLRLKIEIVQRKE